VRTPAFADATPLCNTSITFFEPICFVYGSRRAEAWQRKAVLGYSVVTSVEGKPRPPWLQRFTFPWPLVLVEPIKSGGTRGAKPVL